MTLKVTSYPRDLTMFSEATPYVSLGVLDSIEPMNLTSVINRDLYNIRLVDSNMILKDSFSAGLYDSILETWLCFVDNADGQPETSEALLMYRGIIQGYSYDIDTKAIGKVEAIISGSNPLASLDATDPFYTSKYFVNQL